MRCNLFIKHYYITGSSEILFDKPVTGKLTYRGLIMAVLYAS